MIKKLVDLLWPVNARCIGCGDPSGAERDALCEKCLADREAMRVKDMDGRCKRCMSPLDPSGICDICGVFGDAVDAARFAVPYTGIVRNEIHALKYSGMGCLSEYMGDMMTDAPEVKDIIQDFDVIIPAPIDAKRLAARGYNQALLLARRLSQLTGIPVNDVLRRGKYVEQQAHLDRVQRLGNLKGVIECGLSLTGKRVILTDDVRTTGATAAACADALKTAGAAKVVLLTYAGTNRNA